jgi:hypothetical protein
MSRTENRSTSVELEHLRKRLEQLESGGLKARGRTDMRGAAEYIGRSKEWLRQLNAPCRVCGRRHLQDLLSRRTRKT